MSTKTIEREFYTPDYAALGSEVARIRRNRGWSMEAVAQAAGITRRTVINIENGSKVPRLDTLWAVAIALDVYVGDLIDVL